MFRRLAFLAGIITLASGTAHAQTAVSAAMPASPTYVDVVTGLITIPGDPSATGTVTYSVDGGAEQTAPLANGKAYLNVGQLSIGSHLINASIGNAGVVVKLPAPPIHVTVTDQAFAFAGAEGYFYTDYTNDNLIGVFGLAVDSKDTVYLSDPSDNKLVSIDVFGKFTYLPVTTWALPTAGPTGLAFDSGGNLFIGDHGNSRVLKYTPEGVVTALSIPGLGRPGQLVIDKSHDLLYIVDQDNNRVLRYSLNIGGTPAVVLSNVTRITDIAVDQTGSLYFSDTIVGFGKIGATGPAIPPFTAVLYPVGIYVDRQGFLYLSDDRGAVFRVDAEGHQTQVAAEGGYGASEDSQGHIYLLSYGAAGTAGGGPNVLVLSPGFGGLANNLLRSNASFNSLIYTMPQSQTSLTAATDPSSIFAIGANSESCPYFSQFGSCSISVTLNAKVPGVQAGKVTAKLLDGPSITTLIYGNAVGAAPAFSPGTQTQTPTSSMAIETSGVALDQFGNFYASDFQGNRVYETSGGRTYPLAFTGLSGPTKLAVDGLGTVYVLDSRNNRIVELTTAGVQTAPVIAGTGNTLSAIASFAIDGGGQIYFAGGDSLYRYDRNGVTSTLATGLGASVALALDPYGDAYTLQKDGSLVRIDINGMKTTLAAAGAFSFPTGLAVDASTTAYVTQSLVSAVTLVHPNLSTQQIPVPTLHDAVGIAIDGEGNILVGGGTHQFTFVNRTHQDFNFGNVPVNTTRTLTAFFANSGTLPFTITGLPGDSDFKQVTAADTCANSTATTTIAAAASCDLSYTVAPTALGPVTAFSRVTTDVSVDFDTFTENVVQYVPPRAKISGVNFGNVYFGATSAVQAVVVTNTGSVPVTYGGVSVTGPGFKHIPVSGCGANIPAGGYCNFLVDFAPINVGYAKGSFSIVTNAGTLVAPLTGTGVVGPTPVAKISGVNFGNVNVGTTSALQAVVVTNTGSVPVAYGAVSVTGPGFAYPGIKGCGAKIPVGAYCNFLVEFVPTAAGAAKGSFSIVTDAGTLVAPLTGTGVAGPAPAATISGVQFGSVSFGTTSAVQAVVVTNTGSVPVTYGAVSITGPGFAYLPITGCRGNIPVGAYCNFLVDFTPIADGAVIGRLSIATNAGTLMGTLTGTGTGGPILSVVSSLMPHGDGSYSVVVTITNSGTGTAQNAMLTSVLLGGMAGTPKPQTLGDIMPGNSTSITVVVPPGAGPPHTPVLESITGTYTGGPFGATFRGRLP